MDKRIKYLVLGIILGIVIISVGTYAWLTYRTTNTAMTLTIGEIDGVRVTLSPYQFNGTLIPIDAYDSNNNKYTQIVATNKAPSEGVISLYYHINTIASELRNANFRYTILRSTTTTATNSFTVYKNGNFSSVTANDIDYSILTGETIPGNNTTYYYRVYLWIYNQGNQSGMQGKIFDAELIARISEIPSAYQQVEYLQSSGTQYIDTLYVPKSYDSVKGEFLINSLTGVQSYQALFGTRNSTNGANNCLALSFNSSQTWPSFGAETNIGSLFSTNRKYMIELSRNGLYVDGLVKVSSFSGTTDFVYPILLFARNRDDGAGSFLNGRLYNFKVYSNDVLIRNYIPSYRKSDSIGGLYDTVTNQFYTNSGTGTFTYGNAM